MNHYSYICGPCILAFTLCCHILGVLAKLRLNVMFIWDRMRVIFPRREGCIMSITYYWQQEPEAYSSHTPNANMADLSAGPGLVARKRG